MPSSYYNLPPGKRIEKRAIREEKEKDKKPALKIKGKQ